jgi:hypothetical protein
MAGRKPKVQWRNCHPRELDPARQVMVHPGLRVWRNDAGGHQPTGEIHSSRTLEDSLVLNRAYQRRG